MACMTDIASSYSVLVWRGSWLQGMRGTFFVHFPLIYLIGKTVHFLDDLGLNLERGKINELDLHPDGGFCALNLWMSISA
jgi:hypothetical protein